MLKYGLAGGIIVALLVAYLSLNFSVQTGQGQSATATISFCLNQPPQISTNCGSIAYVGDSYSCAFSATDRENNNMTFFDNTTLFAINSSTGAVSFTPSSGSSNGTHHILITARDNSSCDNRDNSTIFTLTITSPSCSDGVQNQGETGTDCGGPCASCSTGTAAAAAGGGGAGGIVSAAAFPTTYTLESDIVSDIFENYFVSPADVIQFTYKEEIHTIKTKEVGSNYADVIISSLDPIEFRLLLKESKRVDLDKDGIDEFSVRLLSIKGQKIELEATWLRNIEVDKEIIRSTVKTDAKKTIPLKIKNVGKTNLKATLKPSDSLLKILSFDINNFILNISQEREINITINTAGIAPDAYLGYIDIGGYKKVEVILDVESERILFDSVIDVLPEYKRISPGGSVNYQVTMFSLAGLGVRNVTVTYTIKDSQDNVVVMEEESLLVDNQLSFLKTLKTPSDIKPGRYIIAAKVVYDGAFAVASEVFDVIGPEAGPVIPGSEAILVVSLVAIGATILFFTYTSRRRLEKAPAGKTIIKKTIIYKQKRMSATDRKNIEEIKTAHREEKAMEIKRKMRALDEAYSIGALKPETYRKQKNRMQKALKGLK